MKLHLGCGQYYIDGWVNVDASPEGAVKADIHGNIEDLEYPDGSIDEIKMIAVFEHFPRHAAIMQLRKMYKWLADGGTVEVLVPDFFRTVDKMKESASPGERQFWFRHLYGPQDTIQYGTHYDGFSVEKLNLMFSIAGFNECKYELIDQFPSIRFIGIKGGTVKSDEEAEDDIVHYMACYEARVEPGNLFKAWMDNMGLKSDKPHTPAFKTQIVNKPKRSE